MRFLLTLCLFVFTPTNPGLIFAEELKSGDWPDGWTTDSPRDEITPHFAYEATGGPSGSGCFVMGENGQSESIGQWTTTVPVVGGRHYSFRALRKTSNVETPRRNAFVRITWQDDRGELVHMGPGVELSIGSSAAQLAKPLEKTQSLESEQGAARGKLDPPEWEKKARYEFPVDRDTDSNGWTEISDTYQVPPNATQAKIELCLRWSRSGEVRWADVSLQETSPPASRKVRLATVYIEINRSNWQPTALDACRLFAGPIAEAARQGADIICLPETLTSRATGKGSDEVAEPIPGPCSDYFSSLAKKHDLYIVAGLIEQDGPHRYNTAALIGPDGSIGKYRKVCLTRGESAKGYTAGREYPVFETRFGKVGMMVCWDLMFPEVARSLHNHGAEIIALPIAGGDPILARARAIENQIYLVTSCSGGHGLESGIFDYEGKLLGQAKDPEGSVSVVEVDLNKRQYWYWLGDLKSEIKRSRPVAGFQE